MPSIIVPARNNAEFTARCLGTLLLSMNRLQLNCEFILVDDASAPEEKILDVFALHRANAAIAGHQTKIVRSRKHQHYSGVFSIGLHHATRDAIFFISNDMAVTTSFILALLLVSSLSHNFGIVRGTSNYVDSHPEHVVAPKQELTNYPEIEAFSRSVFSANGGRYVEDNLLSGDAVLLKRSLVERIGVLDDLLLPEPVNQQIPHQQARESRYGLVETAYQEFRKKWDLATPASWSVNVSEELRFFEHARAHADRVALKYDFPASVLNDLEIH